MGVEISPPSPAPSPQGGGATFARRAAAPIFVLALFSSAALIFVLQPLFGRMVTPLLGGSPSIWNVSMAFFQAALLAGYLYAHVLARMRELRRQVVIHIIVMIAAWLVLPVQVSGALGDPDSNHPALWLVGVLALSVGAPFAAASATAPLLQAWYARTGRADANDPYYLYAASNLGSFAGLLGYPVLIEPLFGLAAQSTGWSAAYTLVAGLIALSAGLALATGGQAGATRDRHAFLSREIKWKQRLFWIAAAAVPSSLVLGVTQHISTDVASAPLLWVAPLALYLVTFVLAFMKGGLRLEPAALLFHVPALALMVISYYAAGDWAAALAGVLVGFFFSALVCHLALARSRPSAEHLTEFFLFVSLGGVIGGALTAFVAPLVFNNIYEYPLALALACLLRPAIAPRLPRVATASLAAGAMMALLALILMRLGAIDALVVVSALGAAAALVAAGWGADGDERPAALRYGYLAAAAIHAGLMIYFATSLDAVFVAVEVDGETKRLLAAPWNIVAIATSFVMLMFVSHQTVQRRETRFRFVDAAAGLALPTLLLMLFAGLGVELTANGLASVGLAFCAFAFLANGARPVSLAALVLCAFVVIFLDDVRGGRVITQERSFFGVLRTRVLELPAQDGAIELRTLLHGTTIHGAQLATPGLTRQPLTYYNPNTALGEAILAGLSMRESSSLALIGLGAGSTACLMQPQDRLTIFEIDPAVVRLSAGPGGDFTYVPECQPNARIELGDARLQIAEAPEAAFDVIVVDAFSSDAIPAHLLTREAIALYLSRLSADGVVILHLSNRNLALVSEAARVARDVGAPHLFRVSDRISAGPASFYAGLPASVMVLARSPLTLAHMPLASRGAWRVLVAPPGRGWSDDYIALPRALWESMSGAEECFTYPDLDHCQAESAPQGSNPAR